MAIRSAPYFLATSAADLGDLTRSACIWSPSVCILSATALSAHFFRQLVLHFLKGLELRRILFQRLNDVVAELRGHHAAQFFRLQREGRAVELGNHLTVSKPAQIAALILGAVIGILLRHLREIGAVLELFEHILGLGLQGLLLRVRFPFGLEQDVARVHALRHAEVIESIGIRRAKLLVGHVDGRRDLVLIEHGYLVRRLGRLGEAGFVLVVVACALPHRWVSPDRET